MNPEFLDFGIKYDAPTIILMVLQFAALFVVGWNGIMFFFGYLCLIIRRGKSRKKLTDKVNRLCVLVCAHNEESVIREILDNLSDIDYDPESIRVCLIADNCSDRTAEIGREYPEIWTFERHDTSRTGKGAALSWILDRLKAEHPGEFDAYVVLDADNQVRRDFFRRMNDKLNTGASIVQGNRISGNPTSSIVAMWYAIYWTAYSVFFMIPRDFLDSSMFVTGTGFAFRAELVEEGWHTTSITEDVEFSVQRVLKDIKVAFAFRAVCYDEQPRQVKVMIPQLCRWCTGNYQILGKYLGDLWRKFIHKPSVVIIDKIFMLFLGMASFLGIVFSVVNTIVIAHHAEGPRFLSFAVLGFIIMYVSSVAVGLVMVLLLKQNPLRMLGGILTFYAFTFLYSCISFYSFLRPQKTWKTVRHYGLAGSGDSRPAGPKAPASPPPMKEEPDE